jgi:hypothetical protein
MVSAPKMADVVCAQNFFRRKGTKPILQVTVVEVTIIVIMIAYYVVAV